MRASSSGRIISLESGLDDAATYETPFGVSSEIAHMVHNDDRIVAGS
jgi:hypothetical protein